MVWSKSSPVYSTTVSPDTFNSLVKYTESKRNPDFNEEVSVDIYLNEKYVDNERTDSKVVIIGEDTDSFYRDDITQDEFEEDYIEGEWVKPESETVANDIKTLLNRLEN